MSDNAIFAPVASYEKKSGKSKALKLLLIILTVILCLEALVYLFVLPLFRQVKISYSGVKTLTSEELYDAFGDEASKPWIYFDPLVVASTLSANPSVESVNVEKRFPDQVLVQVVERSPVAATLVNIGGKSETVLIDKGGVLFGAGRSIDSESIPLVTGLATDSLTEGSRLHPKLRNLIEQIYEIQQKTPSYLSAISEIRVIPKMYGSYELMLFPIYSHTKILTDRILNENSLERMILMIDVLASVEPDTKQIDLRYGSVALQKTGDR